MSDPRFTESVTPDPIPRPADPRLGEHEEVERAGGAMWGWIAGIALVVLIAFVLIGGWGAADRSSTNTAANTPSAPASAPSTTGAGGNGAAPPAAPSR
jgi:hypothetical protein